MAKVTFRRTKNAGWGSTIMVSVDGQYVGAIQKYTNRYYTQWNFLVKGEIIEQRTHLADVKAAVVARYEA